MQGSELAFYTTRELIDELISRPTFLGLVVHSEDELKNRNWNGEKVFRVRFNSNLQSEEAGRLLELVGNRLEEEAE